MLVGKMQYIDEFDFCDGEQHHFGQSWIECPMCKEIITEEIENEIGGYY